MQNKVQIANLKDSPEWEEFVLLAKSDGTQAGLFKKMLGVYKYSIKKEFDDNRPSFFICPICERQSNGCPIHKINTFSTMGCQYCGLNGVVTEANHIFDNFGHRVSAVIRNKDGEEYKLEINGGE